MVLREETRVEAPPGRVMAFFDGMEENYERWHPDHHGFRWLEGGAVAEGVVAELDETIGGRRKTIKVVYTRVERDRLVEFAPAFRLFRLLLPRMLFRLEPDDGGCRVVQEIHIRIGPLAARLNRKELDAVRRHMAEEGENLKALLEAADRPPGPPGPPGRPEPRPPPGEDP